MRCQSLSVGKISLENGTKVAPSLTCLIGLLNDLRHSTVSAGMAWSKFFSNVENKFSSPAPISMLNYYTDHASYTWRNQSTYLQSHIHYSFVLQKIATKSILLQIQIKFIRQHKENGNQTKYWIIQNNPHYTVFQQKHQVDICSPRETRGNRKAVGDAHYLAPRILSRQSFLGQGTKENVTRIDRWTGWGARGESRTMSEDERVIEGPGRGRR